MRLQGLFEDKKPAEEQVFESVKKEAPERTADPDCGHQQRGGASSVENWLRIGIETKEASNINGGYSLGKGEVVSSILTGSTSFLSPARRCAPRIHWHADLNRQVQPLRCA